MSYVFNEKYFEAEIILENGTLFLSPEDRQSIEHVLNKENIGFTCIELRSGPQASLFSGIIIFINENLTTLIINGLLMPSVYDTMKFVFNRIINGIKNGPIKIVTSNKISIPTPILKFSTTKGHLEAPIPENLSGMQFEKYIDLLIDAIQSLTSDEINKEHLIAEYEFEKGKVQIKSILEYGRAQYEKQQIKNS